MSDIEAPRLGPLCPQLLIGTATAFYRMGQESEHQPGRMVDVILSGVGQPPGTPWEVAFIYHIGYWSHYIDAGEYSSFTHAGILIQRTMHGRLANGRRYVRCVTIEGNATPSGKSRDRLVLRVTRDYCAAAGDRFVRWVDLDPRDSYSTLGDNVELVAGRAVLRSGRAA